MAYKDAYNILEMNLNASQNSFMYHLHEENIFDVHLFLEFCDSIAEISIKKIVYDEKKVSIINACLYLNTTITLYFRNHRRWNILNKMKHYGGKIKIKGKIDLINVTYWLQYTIYGTVTCPL